MTEAEWLACDDPRELFKHKGPSRRSGRKLRLFAVACCRRHWDLLADPRSRRAVEAHELFADGLIDKAALGAVVEAATGVTRDQATTRSTVAERSAGWAIYRFEVKLRADSVANDMTMVAGWLSSGNPPLAVHSARRGEASPAWAAYMAGVREERRAQAELYREFFGNPFRPVAFDPDWLARDGGIIPSLALSIYEERAFDRMPILADALEEAGCVDPVILDHCRNGGEHVRGCWALDSLLGRS